MALFHATPKLKGNRALVLAAVTQNPGALEYASSALREDEDFVITAFVKGAASAKSK